MCFDFVLWWYQLHQIRSDRWRMAMWMEKKWEKKTIYSLSSYLHKVNKMLVINNLVVGLCYRLCLLCHFHWAFYAERPSLCLTLSLSLSFCLSLCEHIFIWFDFCHASFNELTSLKLLFGNTEYCCAFLFFFGNVRNCVCCAFNWHSCCEINRFF